MIRTAPRGDGPIRVLTDLRTFGQWSNHVSFFYCHDSHGGLEPGGRAVIARQLVLSVLRRIDSGQLTVVEDGRRYVFGSGSPQATVIVRSPEAWPSLMRGGRGLADAYVDRLWDSPDLTAVVAVAARNLRGIDGLRRRLTPVREPYQRGRSLWRRNTPSRTRADIAAHYDLGHDLFELMLDKTMMYSSAIFSRRDMSLEEASKAKLERLCGKLDLRSSDHVIEIGTGWGGFALYAAATRGCRVTTTTLSEEQREYAQARVRAAGLADRVTVLAFDYRELRGCYDKLVSIEMIEAVGWKDFGTFFERCAVLLRPDGAMALQAITIDDRLYEVEKASKTFIRSYIFPHGCLPSMEVIARSVARRSDLRIVDLEDITSHYAETLRRWRANFDGAAERLLELGYDERFQRLWRLYLCFCEAGFAERRISDVQIVLAKPRWRGRVSVPEPLEQPAVVAAAGGNGAGAALRAVGSSPAPRPAGPSSGFSAPPVPASPRSSAAPPAPSSFRPTGSPAAPTPASPGSPAE